MITLLTVKMTDQKQANAKMTEMVADAISLGYEPSGLKTKQENNQYIVTCWITPRKDE